MRALPEVRDARIRGDLPRPEIVVHPRLDIAAQLGVSVQSISQPSASRHWETCRRTARSFP